MKTGGLLNTLGLGLLLVCFLAAGWRVWQRAHRELADDAIVIRFAHAQLEPGLREAFDAIARDYMARNPDVTVEQIAIPRRAWASWMETQLIGGTAPDLIQLVNNDPNPILRHFRPIDEWVGKPNPYNDGTALEGLSLLLQVNNIDNEPYREYFFDSGLAQRYEEYGRQVLFGVNYRF